MPRRHLVIAALAVAVAAAAFTAPNAVADAPGSCTNGTDVAVSGNLTLRVDGVDQPTTVQTPGVYGDYAVSLCRWSQTGPGATNIYSWSVQAMNHNPSLAVPMDLDASSLTKTFVLAFTPNAGDRILTLEAKANATSFAVDAAHGNRVTITARPLGFSDIWGNDCPSGTTPLACAAAVSVASTDHVANLTGAVRYAAPDGTGLAGFSSVPGMITSSAAYVFFVWVTCPAPGSAMTADGIKVDLGGPHFKHDGTTPNTSVESVFLPADAIATCFGSSPQAFAASAQITRTENGVTQVGSTSTSVAAGLQYTISATDAGATISIPEVTFSQPTYKFRPKGGRNLARKALALTSVAKTAHLSVPAKGRIAAAVATSTKRTLCTATAKTLYEFGKAGKYCAFTLKSYRSNGKVYASKAVKLRIP